MQGHGKKPSMFRQKRWIQYLLMNDKKQEIKCERK